MTALPSFASASVIVCGDVMLDRYWSGPTQRISPEAPVPVLRVDDETLRPGGAANVALGVAALGAHAVLAGLVGDDEEADLLAALLAEAGVDARLQRVPGWRTITKLRVTSRAQQLMRLDFETSLPEERAATLRAVLAEQVGAALAGARDGSDGGTPPVLVCSDYAKGALADPGELLRLARAAGAAVIVDPKEPDFARWRGARLLKPNLAEFVAAIGGAAPAAPDELHERGQILRAQLELEALLITRGAAGMTLLAEDGVLDLPTRGRDVFDVTGAGDTVAAVTATALAAGAPLPEAVRLANVAAGIAVGRAGTAAVGAEALRGALGTHGGAVLTRAALVETLAAARARGERIVFTNGCFDLLHAGHVAYLEEARALGDRLVVAVNDDASVRRLKGPERPLHDVAHRTRVLAGLRSVDWVTVFDEDTPEALLELIAPDVLAKGGDYAPDEVVGAGLVRARGGRVEVLGLQPGLSSTAIADRLRPD